MNMRTTLFEATTKPSGPVEITAADAATGADRGC
jgi:hypothetical protein